MAGTSGRWRKGFHDVDSTVVTALTPEIVNWDNRLLRPVRHRGQTWLIKTMPADARKREVAAFELARGLVNVAEVHRLDDGEATALRAKNMLAPDANPDNTVLVRLAQSYSARELPQRDLDTAVAGELVFSLWIRRRDADVWNRTYIESGLPVFYDLNAALDPAFLSVATFFERNTYGYGGSWRVRLRGGQPLDSVALRDTDDHANLINDLAAFLQAVDSMCSRLLRRRPAFGRLSQVAGYSRDEQLTIEEFLGETGSTLRSDVEVLKEVLLSEVPTAKYVPPPGKAVPNSADTTRPPTMRDGGPLP